MTVYHTAGHAIEAHPDSPFARAYEAYDRACTDVDALPAGSPELPERKRAERSASSKLRLLTNQLEAGDWSSTKPADEGNA
jgi:hypothetical protein